MSPNLYDLLDVDPTATSDEIRAAWKAAIADLDPTDRRFRAFSDAAGVLLDDEKRAAYDAELAAAQAAEEAAQAEAEAADAAADDEPVEEDSTVIAVDETSDDTTDEPVDASPAVTPADTVPAETAPADTAPPTRSNPSLALMVTAAVVALLSVIVLAWTLRQPGGHLGEASPHERADAAAEEKAEVAAAEQAAEQTLEQVLSYDYRSIDEDLAESTSLLTSEYADQHTALIEQLSDEVVKQKTVVQAVVEYTAITRINSEGTIADVVVFVDQDVSKAKEDPVVLRMWVTATMVREGDEWLLDALCTEGDCA